MYLKKKKTAVVCLLSVYLHVSASVCLCMWGLIRALSGAASCFLMNLASKWKSIDSSYPPPPPLQTGLISFQTVVSKFLAQLSYKPTSLILLRNWSKSSHIVIKTPPEENKPWSSTQLWYRHVVAYTRSRKRGGCTSRHGWWRHLLSVHSLFSFVWCFKSSPLKDLGWLTELCNNLLEYAFMHACIRFKKT